ncbi:MAG TPA: hypothetical protein VF538_18995 [Pyrinomonadaceae bacterium]
MRRTDRRTFLALSVKAAAAAPLLIGRRPFAPAFARERPFEMLVLGDSVMWGQGLREEEKFYTKVRETLEREIVCRGVNLRVLAHSEATILPRHKFCPDAPGEVPARRPTINAEVELAIRDYAGAGVPRESVDLVVMDGGINDVTVARIINFFTPDSEIVSLAREFCGEAMRDLLDTVLRTFPNAVVVVPGYFPVLSEKTDPDTMRDLIAAFFGLDEGAKMMRRAEAEMLKRGPDWFLKRQAALSTLWYRESDSNFQRAVDGANASDAKRRAGTAPHGGRPRAYFAPIPFTPDESYGAPHTALWKITGKTPGGGFRSNDQMYEPRQPQCTEYEHDPVRLLACRAAGTGHPNLRGEAKYAEAILARVREAFGRCPRTAPAGS